jgi:hypothetical protein
MLFPWFLLALPVCLCYFLTLITTAILSLFNCTTVLSKCQMEGNCACKEWKLFQQSLGSLSYKQTGMSRFKLMNIKPLWLSKGLTLWHPIPQSPSLLWLCFTVRLRCPSTAHHHPFWHWASDFLLGLGSLPSPKIKSYFIVPSVLKGINYLSRVPIISFQNPFYLSPKRPKSLHTSQILGGGGDIPKLSVESHHNPCGSWLLS